MINVLEKDECIGFKNYERKIKSPFMIDADFESILVPEDNGQQKPEESYTNKTQKMLFAVMAINKYMLMLRLGEDAVYNFIDSMIEKKINKELVMTKEVDKDFETSSKCWTCDNVYVEGDIKIRDHCHTTEKYRVSTHWDCNITVKLIKHQIPIVFQKLKKLGLASCYARTRHLQF